MEVSGQQHTSPECQAPLGGVLVRTRFGKSPKYLYRHVGFPKANDKADLTADGHTNAF